MEASEADGLELNRRLGSVSIFFQGLPSIGSEPIKRDLQDVTQARTVRQLFEELEKAHATLHDLGIFQSTISEVNAGEAPDSVDVIFRVERKKMEYTLGTTLSQRGQASFEVCGSMPCFMNTPNTLSVSANASGRTCYEYSANYLMPRLGRLRNRSMIGYLQAYKSEADQVHCSSYLESVMGVRARVADQSGQHAVTLDCAFRDIIPSLRNRIASNAISNGRLTTLKTSMKYCTTLDRLRGGVFPTSGYLCQASAEGAGFIGDVEYLKTEASGVLAYSISERLSFYSRLSGGTFFTMGNLPTPIQDRYYLGGAIGGYNIFNGFGNRSVGPAVECSVNDHKLREKYAAQNGNTYDYIGANLYSSLNLLLTYRLPVESMKQNAPRITAFLNFGSAVAEARRSFLSDLIRSMRASAGLGMIMPTPALGGTLELSCCYPFYYGPTDKLEQFQLGFRLRSVPA